jgi:hypothetical protein
MSEKSLAVSTGILKTSVITAKAMGPPPTAVVPPNVAPITVT